MKDFSTERAVVLHPREARQQAQRSAAKILKTSKRLVSAGIARKCRWSKVRSSGRILVIYEGAIISEVDPRTTSREAIGLMMVGGRGHGPAARMSPDPIGTAGEADGLHSQR
jgi:hypothetical protein